MPRRLAGRIRRVRQMRSGDWWAAATFRGHREITRWTDAG
jgi:hypothetical protein